MAFRIDASAASRDLQRIESEILSSIRQSLGQAAAYARSIAAQTTAFEDRTGHLRASIVRGQRGPWSFFVRAGDRSAPYAKVVEDGSRAHEIRPRRTGTVSSRRSAARPMPPVLRFQINGRWFSARVVKHPGTQPTHFMLDASDKAETKLLQFVDAGVGRAVHG